MITREDIHRAYDTIGPYLHRTPVVQTARIAAEPAASVGVAALLTGACKPAPGERLAVIISGANMSPSPLDG